MTRPPHTVRIYRRGVLLLMIASLGVALPLTGLWSMQAHAEDGGGGRSDGNDGGGDGGGNDDGGSDGGGNDDGGSDDGGNDGGDNSGSDGSDGAGGNAAASGGNSMAAGAQTSQARDGALASRLKDRIVPISEIESIANRIKPGEIIAIDLYKSWGSYVYRVKVMQRSGSIYDLKIDAVTRKLLSARER